MIPTVKHPRQIHAILILWTARRRRHHVPPAPRNRVRHVVIAQMIELLDGEPIRRRLRVHEHRE